MNKAVQRTKTELRPFRPYQGPQKCDMREGRANCSEKATQRRPSPGKTFNIHYCDRHADAIKDAS